MSRNARFPLVAAIFLVLVPVTYGLINVAIHGHFVPFRMQSGQNLVEPVGEFENPWGIEYRDAWIDAMLESKGIEYLSFEADALLTRQYLDMLSSEPLLFVRNFIERLVRLPDELTFGLVGPYSVFEILVFAVWIGRRAPHARAAVVPLVMAIGLILFHAWFGSPPRVLAPVRFLMLCSLCGAASLFVANAIEWFASRFTLLPLVSLRSPIGRTTTP